MIGKRGGSHQLNEVLDASIFSSQIRVSSSSDSSSSPCLPGVVYRRAGLPPLKHRGHLGGLMEYKGFRTGAEVGVQTGRNAFSLLRSWISCDTFFLIDLWGHQENYHDYANVPDKRQQQFYEQTQAILKPWVNKTKYFRMKSVEAAKQIEDFSLDFVYIDARHDYCGVKEDLNAYWPKLRPGGVMAGHDFLNMADLRAIDKGQDWSICMDGTRNDGAVRGAVEEFADKHGLVVSVMYGEGAKWASWMFQKRTKDECVA